jgi:hypothetical protein
MRVIQYPRDHRVRPRSRGVLDTPLTRGMTVVYAETPPRTTVMPGLDPGIHQSLEDRFEMDRRVKPGDDTELLHAQRDEAQFAVGVRHQEQH